VSSRVFVAQLTQGKDTVSVIEQTR